VEKVEALVNLELPIHWDKDGKLISEKDYKDKLDKERDWLDPVVTLRQNPNSVQILKVIEPRVELLAAIRVLTRALSSVSRKPFIDLYMVYQGANNIKIPTGDKWELLAKLAPAQIVPDSSTKKR
jgi:hypothetical protein